jgi:hypothetical protein
MAKRASTRCKVLARCIPITDGFSRVRSRRLWGQICPFDISRQDYFDLLCRLLEEYDRAHVRWPKAGVQARLRHLLDESGMSAAEFSRLLGGEPKPRGHDSPRRPKPDRSPHPQAISPFPCQPGTAHLRGAMGSDSQCGTRLSSGPNSTALPTISAIRPRLAPGARVTFIATAPLMQSAADKERSQPDGRFKVGCPDGDVTVADKQVDRFQCLLRTVPAAE